MKADFIGICCLDSIYVIDDFPKENSKIRAVKNYTQAGGFATNASKTYALLGGDAQLHTMVGQSSYALSVCNDLDIKNLSVIDYSDKDFSIPVSMILINKKTSSRTVISSAKDSAFDNLSKEIELSGELLFIDGFYYETAIQAIQKAKSKNIPIVFDADKWRDDRYMNFIQDIDFIIASSDFLPPQCDCQRDVIHFFQELNIQNFAITNGEKNIIYACNNDVSEVSVPQVQAIDTLGAGDVFHGAFCYYIQQNDFVKSLEKASKIASEFCTEYGFKALR